MRRYRHGAEVTAGGSHDDGEAHRQEGVEAEGEAPYQDGQPALAHPQNVQLLLYLVFGGFRDREPGFRAAGCG